MSIFLVIITSFRLVWLHLFSAPAHPHASRGVLDLQRWEELTEQTIKLDGKWEFFPNVFLMEENENTPTLHPKEVTYIHVPHDWRTATNSSTSYGFGSYRLRIFIDYEKGQTYGIRLPKISNSSEVYVNKKLVSQSGKPAEEKQQYEPRNVPQVAYFHLEDTNEIELIIHVANFDRPLEGGLLQAPTFGLIEPFTKRTNFETNIVLVACLIYAFHALYSFVLYFLGNRDKRFIYFFFIIVCVILGTLIGERLLFLWLPVNFEWSIKIIFLTMVVGSYFLMQSIKHLLPQLLQTKFYLIRHSSREHFIVTSFVQPYVKSIL